MFFDFKGSFLSLIFEFGIFRSKANMIFGQFQAIWLLGPSKSGRSLWVKKWITFFTTCHTWWGTWGWPSHCPWGWLGWFFCMIFTNYTQFNNFPSLFQIINQFTVPSTYAHVWDWSASLSVDCLIWWWGLKKCISNLDLILTRSTYLLWHFPSQ